MKIYFLRHGRTEWNANNRIQGSNEKIDLDDEGVKQAEGVAEGFRRAGLEFDRIYSSPYRRAMHTAEIVCAKTGGSPVSDGRIREICFGEYEGTPFFEAGFSDDNEAHDICEKIVENAFSDCSLSLRCFKYDALLLTDEARWKPHVLKEIRRDYSNMLDQGATSVWETKEGASAFGNAGSLCHGWSAIPACYL
jgi:bisphosphoglycerate-dependent phosphoglycerate mutase